MTIAGSSSVMTPPPRPAISTYVTGLALETVSRERAKTVKGENFVHYIALGRGRRGAMG